MKILNEKKYKFQCRQCYTEILFSKKDCWVDRTYEDFWLTCPVCGRRHDNQTYGLFRQEYIEEYDEKNIINKNKNVDNVNVDKDMKYNYWRKKYNDLEQETKRAFNLADKYLNITTDVRECIKEFLCTEEYTRVDGIAIADNYKKLLEILDKGE